MTIKTKYSPGDKVWAIVENRAQCLRVNGVMVNTLAETFDESGKLVYYKIKIKYYLGDGYWINDIDCFSTKEGLIKSL